MSVENNHIDVEGTSFSSTSSPVEADKPRKERSGIEFIDKIYFRAPKGSFNLEVKVRNPDLDFANIIVKDVSLKDRNGGSDLSVYDLVTRSADSLEKTKGDLFDVARSLVDLEVVSKENTERLQKSTDIIESKFENFQNLLDEIKETTEKHNLVMTKSVGENIKQTRKIDDHEEKLEDLTEKLKLQVKDIHTLLDMNREKTNKDLHNTVMSIQDILNNLGNFGVKIEQSVKSINKNEEKINDNEEKIENILLEEKKTNSRCSELFDIIGPLKEECHEMKHGYDSRISSLERRVSEQDEKISSQNNDISVMRDLINTLTRRMDQLEKNADDHLKRTITVGLSTSVNKASIDAVKEQIERIAESLSEEIVELKAFNHKVIFVEDQICDE